jgi:hypothetical protein
MAAAKACRGRKPEVRPTHFTNVTKRSASIGRIDLLLLPG